MNAGLVARLRHAGIAAWVAALVFFPLSVGAQLDERAAEQRIKAAFDPQGILNPGKVV
jgi:FAD/FMN-containing dehydrogenase